MIGRPASRTELRLGLVEQVRRPRVVMEPLSAEELHVLGADDDQPRQHLALHDSSDRPGD